VTRGGPWPHVGLAAVAVAAAAVLADPAPRVQEVFHLADRDIDESSGLVLHDGLVLTVNDSGGDPVVYAVDPSTGETVGRTTYSADEVEDVEALAVGPDGTVWVADIGDNGGDRDSVALYAVPGVGRGDRTVEAPRYELTYPQGPRDAETLLADPRNGRLYVVSKGLFGGHVFAVPQRLHEGSTNVLRPVAAVDGLLTDGTFTADGAHALLRGYGRLYLADTSTWRYLADMPLPDQRQGEGIALAGDPQHVLLSSEGARTAILSVPLAGQLVDALRGTDPAGDDPAGDDPAGDDPAGTHGASAGDQDPAVAADEGGLAALQMVGLASVGAFALVAVGLAVRGARRRSRSTP
jgi:hypothetical protein